MSYRARVSVQGQLGVGLELELLWLLHSQAGFRPAAQQQGGQAGELCHGEQTFSTSAGATWHMGSSGNILLGGLHHLGMWPQQGPARRHNSTALAVTYWPPVYPPSMYFTFWPSRGIPKFTPSFWTDEGCGLSVGMPDI